MASVDLSSISSSGLLPVEFEILQQYQFLNSQLITLNNEITRLTSKSTSIKASLASNPESGNSHVLLENLRNIEVKIGLIHTLFKGAVYTLFLDQDNDVEDQEFEQQEGVIDDEEEANS
ncbi:DASH complex subunit Dad3-domain-containing protein [Scheffersomyces amazonensis]|uniref:DASH complex subunit Dad3-domain-containing protein n=1 Tax=Scheffersomyces amazonensis TaxID=1078765 RepID=UPI00315D1E07